MREPMTERDLAMFRDMLNPADDPYLITSEQVARLVGEVDRQREVIRKMDVELVVLRRQSVHPEQSGRTQ